MPKSNSQQKSTPDDSTTSKWGLNGEERVALLRNKGRTEQFQRRASWWQTSHPPPEVGGRGEGKWANVALEMASLPNCKQASNF